MSSKSSSQVIKCKAAVCWSMGEAVKVEEIRVEPPQPSEVRVKMLYASVCHTDLLCIQGYPSLYLYLCGTSVVESIGEEVIDIKEGDIVIPTLMSECKECENCESGNTNMCLKYPLGLSGLMLDGSSRMSINGKKLYHVFACSTWSEYMVVNVNYVLKLESPDDMCLPHASFLSCGFSTGFGAPWKEAKLHKGSTVAVIGLGAVGLGVCMQMTWEAFGMTDFINPESDTSTGSGCVSHMIKDLTGGRGVDYCFECTGFAPFVSEALEATKLLSNLNFQGKGMAIVIGATNVKHVQINSLTLLCGRTLKGSIFGGLKPKTDLPLLLNKCKDKEILLDQLLTHQVSLPEIIEAFQLLKHQDCVKVLITF
ncbi:hypothetical protein FEM48_Zijuj03G0201400 [Ziziphus jujuba var. spinosa]|uniref:Alcohol dehydrogenase-like 1 n=1 Tax=Ziziphus jujuba var. spinosa TaxID=714518 RepID=A0A978VSD3_ZIZJJ|nr:hypothetical protein FEM48_Zijuj03G0201400 [Ziziphus jujuba var. spinosa]